MHVHTFNFSEFGGGVRELLERVIDALFHVRSTDGCAALVVSLFLPDAQCHVLVELDDTDPDYCDVTIVEQSPETVEVLRELSGKEYDETVGYIRHIVEAFLDRTDVSNVLVTTDGRRIQDVTSKLGQKAPRHPER